MNKKYLKRLQGQDWTKVRDKMTLVDTFINPKGNIRGIYTDGKNLYTHWMSDYEKEKFLKNKGANK